jgi:Fe-S cluster biosynthesis and repair protein YggX
MNGMGGFWTPSLHSQTTLFLFSYAQKEYERPPLGPHAQRVRQILIKSRQRNAPHKDSHMARTVNCIKLGKEAEGLDFPPYPGELGKRIYESVSKEAWAAWLKHQTMLLNENRLNLADARARQYLARQMEKHFFGEGADAAQGYVPPPSAT